MKYPVPATGSADRPSGKDRPTTDTQRTRVRLLVVDSNPKTCPSILKATRGHAQVVGQPDARGAREILRRQSFDAIIIRLRDSNTDGAELLRTLAASGDQERLVVITPKIEEVQAARLLGVARGVDSTVPSETR
jgi:DNA-binding response OmpR family regulator